MINAVVMVLAWGAVSADPFEASKAKATEVENLARMLEAYGGKCKATDPVEAQECAQRAKGAQANYKGKTLYAHLGSAFENMMEVAEADGNNVVVLLTPVVDAGAEVALTFHKPQKLDKEGTIIVPKYPVSGPLLDDTATPGDLKRLVKTGQVTVEIVFTVKGPWQLKKKDGEPVKGLEVQVSAVRLANRRSGKSLVSMAR
ncbi:MAG: hypothetical protein HY904_13650 [Deltaproteobacteria bacterium]|nr:hypothetical protein [Deltaproteobacteria bacterium]